MTWPAMKTFSQRRWLALSGEEQETLSVTSFWLGAQQSSCLIQVAEMMDPGVKSLACSISRRELILSGSNSPLQGTNLKMRL